MDFKEKSKADDEQKEEATDDRTLAEIEETEKVSDDSSRSSAPAPDEGSGRSDGDDAGRPM